MTSAPSPKAVSQGEGSFAERLQLEVQQSRAEAAASATRLAFLCHSPDASPAALEAAGRDALTAISRLVGAATLAQRT